MKQKWSAGKITAVICGSIVAVSVLIGAFYISVNQLVRGILAVSISNKNYQQAYRDGDKDRDDNNAEEDTDRREERENRQDRATDDIPYDDKESDNAKKSNSSEYYEFHDEIREDLSYQVEFEVYDEEYGENGNVLFTIIYPICYGEEENLISVNNALQKELAVLRDYAESVAEWLGEDEIFTFTTDTYVTYMDEEILSVAYVEHGYLNGEYYESYVVSVNVDMDSKMTFTNSQLLDIDDDFSIEFRNRCEKQNGEISSLYYYSDQDITQMLNSEDDLIIFYTPLGMEVGFNYYYGWVTVTYPDYQKYQKRF